MDNLDIYAKQLLELCINFSPKLMLALMVLVIGFWFSNKASILTGQILKKSNAQSAELQTFLGSIVNFGLKILVVISVAGIIGIETTSFVGIIAAMGFAVGMALQGNLSNFAAGVMILIMRPFKVGDEILVKDIRGFVKEIQIFHTVLGQLDRTIMIVPNSFILSNPIKNSSFDPTRRVNTKFNIAYTEDFFRVKQLIINAGFAVEEIDETINPYFYIRGFNDHSMELSVSFSVKDGKFWSALIKVREAIILALQENKVHLAYPEGVTIGEYGNSDHRS